MDISRQKAEMRERDREMIPVALVRAMFGLTFVILMIVAYARFTDRPLEALPPVADVVTERSVVLSGDMSGAAAVHGADGTLIANFDSEQGGFISGVYRVLERERLKHGVAVDAPVRLVKFDNGRMMIFDDTTNWRADLMGFGATNRAAFATLLAE
ncbi:photosynthetic complex assembly protein PuhC [Algirhabdus cladophorae]|uniref:photosynthetic complex assembly protein PuhC n=1 Tax=Algirhabdus cladophorae TaxID=3377108 RepID=UPI003B846A51